MKGLIIWAYGNCRSTMALYREVQRQATVPVYIVISNVKDICDIPKSRKKVGFRADEFVDIDAIVLNDNYELATGLINRNLGFTHLFCAYQMVPIYRQLISYANCRGEKVFVAGEAPCNMSSGLRWWFKEFYLRFVLGLKVNGIVPKAEKFICFSGDAYKLAALAGWPRDKVVPFGYFPPPIEGSKSIQRKTNHPFRILATGILSRYRGADVLVRALKLLKDRGIEYEALITQEGELLSILRRYANRFKLPISFPGLLSMKNLVSAYENCSVYVGAGRSEPWGMRLNDAVNCGTPLVVSRGMGGVKLVEEYGCGLSFAKDDAVDLADKLGELARNESLYNYVATKAFEACQKISPETMANKLLKILDV